MTGTFWAARDEQIEAFPLFSFPSFSENNLDLCYSPSRSQFTALNPTGTDILTAPPNRPPSIAPSSWGGNTSPTALSPANPPQKLRSAPLRAQEQEDELV